MSASSQPDAFAEAWKRSVTHKLDTGTGLNIPRPKEPPRISIFSTHEFAHANKPFLTWKPELMLGRRSVSDARKIKQTLVDLMHEDNFEQLEKVYQYEYAVAEQAEHWEVRLARANTEFEEWKHVAEEGRVRFNALKTTGDYVAVAWHEALLDRAQGRVILWAGIVAREKRRVRRQKTKVAELLVSASEAVALLKQRKESILEQGHEQEPKADAGWFMMAYLTARENAEIEICTNVS
ncbi:hypothetical protein KCU71_g1709, partial [Aureobasidium melanogenum]